MSTSGYTDARYGTLLVTNNFGIVAGQDEEDDDSLRYRINLKLQSTGGAAEADLRLAILNVPGILDVQFEPEAGTYTCYVYGISPAVPPSLLQMVQAQINATTAWPLTGTAVQPDLIGISFSTTVTFVAGATAAEQQTALENAVSEPGPSPLRTYNSHAHGRGPHQQLVQLLMADADYSSRLMGIETLNSRGCCFRLRMTSLGLTPPGTRVSVLNPLLP